MAVLLRVIEVKQGPEEAFDAVADFSSSAAWDPGVIAATRTREGAGAPVGIGAEYLLKVSFRGRESEMVYRTTGYERPNLVVLEGVGPRIAAVDTIRFEQIDGGTRVTYVADLRLIGLARIAGPLLGGEFEAMGDRALAGMQAWLGREYGGTVA